MHTHKLRVDFNHTDAGGVVYHANYLNFFEQARTEWLRDQGHNLSELVTQGFFFAVSKVQIKYLSPAQLDDALLVQSEVIQRKHCSVVFHQRVVRAEQPDNVLCEAEIRLACLGKNMRPVIVPYEWFQ